jgi:hypothetical protein
MTKQETGNMEPYVTVDGLEVRDGYYIQDGPQTLYKVSSSAPGIIKLIVCLDGGKLPGRTTVRSFTPEQVHQMSSPSGALCDRYEAMLDGYPDPAARKGGIMTPLETPGEMIAGRDTALALIRAKLADAVFRANRDRAVRKRYETFAAAFAYAQSLRAIVNGLGGPDATPHPKGELPLQRVARQEAWDWLGGEHGDAPKLLGKDWLA